MRIYFERSGGFAGMLLTTSVDTDSLSEEEAVFYQTKVEESGFFDLPERLGSPGGGADRFQYHLSVETKESRHSIDFGETATPEALTPLIERLTALARSSH